MRKSLLIISLSIILLSVLAINVSPFDDYSGNHNDIECHSKPKEIINESKGIELIIQIIFSVIALVFTIIVSFIFLSWCYFTRKINK